MAYVRIPAENRVLDEPGAIRDFLRPFGIDYEQWLIPDHVTEESGAEEVLETFATEVEILKQRGGYVTADVIDVTPDVPGLQAMLDRFNKEHRHAEDEVRFIVRGRGIFYIHPETEDPLFSIEVESGDLINVPAGTKHWFDLCADRTIRAIRLFREKAGWTPLYTGDEVASGYQPLCFGPNFMADKGLRLEQGVALK